MITTSRLNATAKAWWVKEVASEIYVSGRLTSRQIKNASEAGFGSLVSLYTDYDDSASVENHVPNTEEIKQICEVSDLPYTSLIKVEEEWASLDTIEKFSHSIANLNKPLLLFADNISKAIHVVLLYFQKQTVEDDAFEPKFKTEDVFRKCAFLGMIPIPPEVYSLIEDISGTIEEDDFIDSDTDSSIWTRYWPAHHITKTWFIAGQIRTDELDTIESAGFKTVVNMRLGVTHEGKPSQEQVTLLNVPDDIATFSDDMKLLRQNPDVAKGSRIKPEVDNVYISSQSEVNYETRNPEEFGDEVGYNEDMERAFFKNTSLEYVHIPIVPHAIYNKAMFEDMKDTLLEAANKGPVLLHARSVERVAYIGVLIAAVDEGRSLKWALGRLSHLGFPIGPDHEGHIYNMYCDVLG